MKRVLVLKYADGGWVALGLGKGIVGYSEASLEEFCFRLREEGIDYEVREIKERMERWRGDDFWSDSPDLDDEFDF